MGIPTSPLMAAGAVVFGTAFGSLYNYLGSILGAALSFYLARGLGHELILHLFGNRLKRFEKTLERHGFWAIVRIRFIPVPFPVVNFGSALVGVKPGTFLLASALGLIIPIPIWTYLWSSILGVAGGDDAAHAGRNVALALGLFLLLSFAPRWLSALRRKRALEASKKTQEP